MTPAAQHREVETPTPTTRREGISRRRALDPCIAGFTRCSCFIDRFQPDYGGYLCPFTTDLTLLSRDDLPVECSLVSHLVTHPSACYPWGRQAGQTNTMMKRSRETPASLVHHPNLVARTVKTRTSESFQNPPRYLHFGSVLANCGFQVLHPEHSFGRGVSYISDRQAAFQFIFPVGDRRRRRSSDRMNFIRNPQRASGSQPGNPTWTLSIQAPDRVL